MGSNDASRTSFDLRTISIYVVIALIVGAGAGYMVGNSPIPGYKEDIERLGEQASTLDENYNSLYSDHVKLTSDYSNLALEKDALHESISDLESDILYLENPSPSEEEIKSYLEFQLLQFQPYDPFNPFAGEQTLTPYYPSTHTAKFWKELDDSLEITFEIQPPEGEEHIDIGDIFTLTVKVTNTYGPLFIPQNTYLVLPPVWFKNIYLYVSDTPYAEVVNPNIVPNYWSLVTGQERLKDGETVTQKLSLKALSARVGEETESVANIKVYACIDYVQFFKNSQFSTAVAQIRAPLPP